MNNDPDVRWKQRFSSFDRVFVLLRSALEDGPEALNDLEKEGVVQRFECCFELAWKTIKDYMEYSGTVFSTITPRAVLKEAFAAKVIEDGKTWIQMLDQRNLLSHTYSQQNFEQAVAAIHQDYLEAFSQVHELLLEKRSPS